MSVQGLECAHEVGWQLQRIYNGTFGLSLFRHAPADVAPQFAVAGHFAARHVIRDRHPGQFDDAAFDGVEQREVAHRPGEQRAFAIAGPVQEEWRCRQVENGSHADPALHGLDSGNPQPRGLDILLRLLPFVAFARSFLGLAIFLPIAVVRLVVQHEDVLQPQQSGADSLQHLAFGLHGRDFRPMPLKQGTVAFGLPGTFPPQKGVVIGNDDPRPLKVRQHAVGDQFIFPVVTVRIVRLQDTQSVSNSDAGRDDEEATGETGARRQAQSIQRLPRNQHGHYSRLAGAGGELQGDAQQIRICPPVGAAQVFADALVRRRPTAADAARHLGKPDGCFNSFDLAEERPAPHIIVLAPVTQQVCGHRRDAALIHRQLPPGFHMAAYLVDDRHRVVFLSAAGLMLFVEGQFRLTAFLRRRNRRYVLRTPPTGNRSARGPAVTIQLPMPSRRFIGRVEYGVCEEIRHGAKDTNRICLMPCSRSMRMDDVISAGRPSANSRWLRPPRARNGRGRWVASPRAFARRSETAPADDLLCQGLHEFGNGATLRLAFANSPCDFGDRALHLLRKRAQRSLGEILPPHGAVN